MYRQHVIVHDCLNTYLFLNLGIFFLGVNQVENDVECACKNEGKEETESGQIDVALSAK